MDSILLVICLNLVSVICVFAWVWFMAGLNKQMFSKKLNDLDSRLGIQTNEISKQETEKLLSELKVILAHINDCKEYIKETKDISVKVSEQHEEYHAGMLEKLNKAGELIVNYENFYESTLNELDEVERFIEGLSKRPAVSSDPDFANFHRAITLMTQIIARYSNIAQQLKKEMINKTG